MPSRRIAFPKVAPKVPRGRGPVEAALIVLVLAAAAWGGWRVAHPPRSETKTTAPAAPDPAPLTRFDAFFRNGAPLTAPGQGEAAASLGWRLTGTRTGARPSAILQRPDGTQAAFRLGEAVGDGLTLKAVGVDHVILAAPGRQHRLEFGEAPPPPPPPAEGQAASAALSADAAQAAAAMGTAPPQEDAYVQALRPHAVGGRVEGFVWRRGAAGGALAGLGLREGDVILSVDGEPMTSQERVWELGPALASGRPVTIRYRRGGQELTAVHAPSTD